MKENLQLPKHFLEIWRIRFTNIWPQYQKISISKLADIVQPADVRSSKYIDFAVENNDKDPKIDVDNHVRLSKYKNILAKVYTPNWPENLINFILSGKIMIIHLMV